jgi:single-stranded DNA-binding protein
MNSCNVTGTVVCDPVINKKRDGTPACTLRLCSPRPCGGVDHIDVRLYEENALFVKKNIHKGDMIAVCGKIETSNYTSADGVRRSLTDIVAVEMYKIDQGNGSGRRMRRCF